MDKQSQMLMQSMTGVRESPEGGANVQCIRDEENMEAKTPARESYKGEDGRWITAARD